MSVWSVGVDIGGTFTDILAVDMHTADTRYLKVPSVGARRPRVRCAPRRRGASRRGWHRTDQDRVGAPRHTLATNAIIERELAPTAVVTTEGFGDVLEVARGLGIGTVIAPLNPGTLCALGLLSADVRIDASRRETHASTDPRLPEILGDLYAGLEAEATATVSGSSDGSPARSRSTPPISWTRPVGD